MLTTYRVHCLKHNQQQSHTDVQKLNQKLDFPNPLHDIWVKVTLFDRPLPTPLVQKLCRCEQVHSWAENVFILEYHFESELFTTVYKAFSSVYPGKEVPNKTVVYRLVGKCCDTGSVCVWQVLTEQQNSWSYSLTGFKRVTAALMEYGCKNSTLPLVWLFVDEGVHV
jgi:hypothetical protein